MRRHKLYILCLCVHIWHFVNKTKILIDICLIAYEESCSHKNTNKTWIGKKVLSSSSFFTLLILLSQPSNSTLSQLLDSLQTHSPFPH